MSIQTEVLAQIEKLVSSKSDLAVVALALEEHIDSSTPQTASDLTSVEIVSRFVSQYEDDLSNQQITFFRSLLISPASHSDDVVVVHELSPSTEDPHNITAFLADGGIGRVWLAQDQQVQRQVVLKQLLPGFQNNDGAKHRFVNEAKVTGRLQHPNIVPVYSMNWDNDDSPFYTMKYIRGDTLAAHLEDYHNSEAKAFIDLQSLLDSFLSVCQAIAYAHDRGIIHRDIKPENIAIGEFGEVTVLDWGLADNYDADADSPRTSGVLGTPNYMPPEQATGKEMTGPFSDIYSLGAILFEIICGSVPRYKERQQRGLDELLSSIIAGDIPDATKHCPFRLKGLAFIANKCLHVEPQLRYRTVGELISDIRAWKNDLPITARPDNFTRAISRTMRHNRRTLFAAGILLPITALILVVFVNNYNNEYANLQSAKRVEVLKQHEYLQTKQELAKAIHLATEAKANADENTDLANRNRQLAAKNRTTYLREQTQAEKARDKHITATEKAVQAKTKAQQSRTAKVAAKTVADNNRLTVQRLSRQIQSQLFESLARNADSAVNNSHYQPALAWTSAALTHAISSDLDSDQISQQRLTFDALNTHIPNLESLTANADPVVPVIHDSEDDFFYLASKPPITPQTESTIEKRDARTLNTIWKHDVGQHEVAGHCLDAPTRTYAALIAGSNKKTTVNLYDADSGDLKSSRHLDLVLSNSPALYLTTSTLVIVQDRYLSIFDRDTFKLITQTPTTSTSITKTVLSPRQERIATLHGRHAVRLWDTSEGLLLTAPIKTKTAIVALEFQQGTNNLQLILSSGEQLVIDSEQFLPKAKTNTSLPLASDEKITTAVFHPQGLLTAYGTTFGRVFISNASGSLATAPLQLNDATKALILSSDSRVLVIKSGHHLVDIYDISNQKYLYRNLDHPSKLAKLILTHNNRFILSQLESSEIRQWDLAISRNPPHQISVGIRYDHAHFDDERIIGLVHTGRVELRQADSPFNIVDSTALTVAPSNAAIHVPHPGGIFRLTDEQLIHIGYGDDKLSVHQIPLYAPISGHALNQNTHSLALTHSDRTISFYTPNSDVPYKRLESLPVSYDSIAWNSDDSVIGLIFDAATDKTRVDFLRLDQADNPPSHTLSGGPYQFLQDVNGDSYLISQIGNILSLQNDTLFQATHNLSTGIAITAVSNPTLSFMKNGTVQQLRNGVALEYQTIFPDQATRTTHTNYFALLTDQQATIFQIGKPEPISLPINFHTTPNSLDLSNTGTAVRLLAATASGLHLYELASEQKPISQITKESLAITGTTLPDYGKRERSPMETIKAFNSLPKTDFVNRSNPLGWLMRHSSRIDHELWMPIVKSSQTRFDNLDNPTSQQASRILDELVRAQIGARQFRGAIRSLTNGYKLSGQVRHLYQACVLAVWLDDSDLFNVAYTDLNSNVDLATPQEFVYFSMVSAFVTDDTDFSDLNNRYNTLKNSNSTNPVLQRALMMNAVRLNDIAAIHRYVQRILKSRPPLPIRNFSLSIGLAEAPATTANLKLLRTLESSQELMPAMETGNPGISWTERCITDIGLRKLRNRYKEDRP